MGFLSMGFNASNINNAPTQLAKLLIKNIIMDEISSGDKDKMKGKKYGNVQVGIRIFIF